MSHPNQLGERLLGADVDVRLAKVGVVASVFLLGLRLLAEQVFLVVIPVAVGVACTTYLATHDRVMQEVALPRLSRSIAGYLPALVVASTALLVAAVRLTGGRSLPVLLLTGGIGAILLVQILLVEDDALHPPVVLFEILAVALAVRLGALFAVPGFVGQDIWVHGPIWVEGVAASGSLQPLAESKYLLAPLYHALGALGALVTGSARTGIYLTVGLVVPLSALFVYGIGALFVPARWALAATALYAFADQFVRWGIHLIPTSLGLAFFLGVLYCTLKVVYTDADRWASALLVAFSLAVVFTHQVSTAIMLIVLAVAVAVGVALDVLSSDGWRQSTVGLAVAFAVSTVATLTSWSMAPWTGGGAEVGEGGFLVKMLRVLQITVLEDAGFLNLESTSEPAAGPTAAPPPTFLDTLVPYLELTGFMLLLSAAVVGGLVMLRWQRRRDATLILLLAGAVMFVFTFGFNVFGITVFLPGRWIGFLYIPLALVAAVGLFHVASHAPRGVLVAVVLVFAFAYPTTMAVAEKATLDDPAFEDRHARAAYTESEIAGAETIQSVLPPASADRVRTDYPYWRLYHPESTPPAAVLQVDRTGPVTDDPIVYRTYQGTGAASFHYGDDPPFASTQVPYDKSTVCPDGRNYVYANDDVLLCTTPADEEVSDG
ncbi:glycosyltransferase family 39 protein [Halorubellus sp. JP-L1]|uniref:glycosyltransferase family 39 protein n=1 Tax=Halorubellus sp. JP-L1 TaxID=2715753 RepID=UPI00140CC539|nr:glycosyltransferase family 39 protein [Halorubellus sp. JP-L1]NHN43193.1 glycosyltransferase family 39 protein [Halorubellus sp. JP-L1]